MLCAPEGTPVHRVNASEDTHHARLMLAINTANTTTLMRSVPFGACVRHTGTCVPRACMQCGRGAPQPPRTRRPPTAGTEHINMQCMRPPAEYQRTHCGPSSPVSPAPLQLPAAASLPARPIRRAVPPPLRDAAAVERRLAQHLVHLRRGLTGWHRYGRKTGVYARRLGNSTYFKPVAQHLVYTCGVGWGDARGCNI